MSEKIENYKNKNKPHVWWLKNKETIRRRIIKNFELNDDYRL